MTRCYTDARTLGALEIFGGVCLLEHTCSSCLVGHNMLGFNVQQNKKIAEQLLVCEALWSVVVFLGSTCLQRSQYLQAFPVLPDSCENINSTTQLVSLVR